MHTAEEHHVRHEIQKIVDEPWRGLTPTFIASKVIGGALLRQTLHEGKTIPDDVNMLRELARLLRVEPQYLKRQQRQYEKAGGTANPASREYIRPEGKLKGGGGRPPGRIAPARKS